jgi:fructose-1,6-bisphosphatase/inositol monophosphatase family enzyme
MTLVDIDAVSEIVREATATAIVPYFQSLSDHQIDEKSPGETVTVADREAEAFISSRLEKLLPGVPVVGEEAVADTPGLMDALCQEPLAWLVDPLDGTSNFARGEPHWATLIALVRNGETVASWTYRHGDSGMYVAELGQGAWRDGRRLSTDTSRTALSDLRGAVLTRFLTPEEREQMQPGLVQFGQVTAGFSCAGYEYPAIVDGEQEFALFQRLMPWDHAAGCLLLTEAGGVAQHPDGTPFRPDHTNRRGLLLANSPDVWCAVRDVLYPSIS